MNILTYEGRQFYMDGKPIELLSGAMHYFRIPREYWKDRLIKLKECGFNCVETYTCWNLHEPEEGKFDFSGMLDISAYIETAKEVGLYVIMRPGPYICAEWDLGGLPAWMLTYKDMDLRCDDEIFLSKVRRYYKELLNRLRPHFAKNGGNVIMLQIENEYGSYGNDKTYLRKILEIYKENDIDCFFFTSDGPTYTMLGGGALPEYLAVANFGSDVIGAMGFLARYQPDKPLMCGEYWCGWFDHWGEPHHTRDCDHLVKEFNDFLNMNASMNYYMFHGGTNFGFWNGANYDGGYKPDVTSYDYGGAPLTETGDRTEFYYRLRDAIEKKYGSVPPLTAKESEKKAYGKLMLTESAALFENLENIAKPVHVVAPKFMEDIGQDFGYVLYRATINGPFNDWGLHFDCVRDRAQVFVDGEHKATYVRDQVIADNERVKIPLGYNQSAQLDILVENMGRINYGRHLRDQKGMVGMSFGNQHHFGWDMYPLTMKDLSRVEFKSLSENDVKAPVFLRGYLEVEGEPCDTFIRLDGFTKGFVVVNGFNIGRFFNPAGPQKTLYVPAPMLKSGKNEIIVFESDGYEAPVVEFTDVHDIGQFDNFECHPVN